MMDKSGIYTVGGTVQAGGGIYIPRKADEELLNFCLNGEFVYILAPRQIGKSSLMVNTVRQLDQKGISSAIIDLTKIGVTLEANEWYLGILTIIKEKLGINLDLIGWWRDNGHISVNQRLFVFFQEILLKQIQGSVVLFFDEVDSTLSIKFADDFFAMIRAIYNERGTNNELRRISFVLIGVATPGELISNPKRTPFNIGKRVELTGFTLDEALPLAGGFACQNKHEIMKAVLGWTNGQPYLTQKICLELSKFEKLEDGSAVREAVERLFLGERASEDSNIDFVGSMLTSRSKNPRRTMLMYQKIRTGIKIPDDEHSAEKAYLRLSGVVGKKNGFLEISNAIYTAVFDPKWIENNIPRSPATPWILTSLLITLLALTLVTYQYFKARNVEISVQAQTFIEGYKNSGSPEVKLTNLANLMKLGGEYRKTGLDLYLGDSEEEQLRLFDLSIPNNVADELILVVQEIYQYSSNDDKGNTRLTAMAVPLSQISLPGSPDLLAEIESWISARKKVSSGDYQYAIPLYDIVINKSKDRGIINFQALLERGMTHSSLKSYQEALSDYDAALGQNQDLSNEVRDNILQDKDLFGYFVQHPAQYGNLAKIIAVPTEETRIIILPTPTIVQPVFSSGALPESAQRRLGKGVVTSFAYSSNTDRMAVGTTTGIYVYNVDDFSEIVEIPAPYPVRQVDISPDGKLVGGTFYDLKNEVYLWNVETGKITKNLVGHRRNVISIAFSPDGKRVATGDSGWWTMIWDVNSGSLIKTLINSGVVTSLAWSPDGLRLASGIGNYSDGNAKVILWNLRDFKQIYSLGEFNGFIWDVSFSPDGQLLAGGLDNGTIVVWDAEQGLQRNLFDSNGYKIEMLGFSPTGGKLASGVETGEVKIWDPITGELEKTINMGEGPVEGLKWVADSEILAVASVGNICLIDVPSNKITVSEPRFSHEVSDVEIESAYGTIVSGHNSEYWSSGNVLVNRGEVVIWGSGGEVLRKFVFSEAGVNNISLSPDLTKLAISFKAQINQTSVSSFGNWATEGGTRSIIVDRETGKILASFEAAKAIEWIPSTSKLVILYEDSVKVQDYTSGKTEQEYKLKDLSSSNGNFDSRIYMSDDGTRIAYISSDGLIIYELLTGKEIEKIQLSEQIESVAWEPNNQKLAIGMGNGEIIIWDVQSQKQISTFKDHVNPDYYSYSPWVLAFSPNGNYLAVGLGAMDIGATGGEVAIYDINKNAFYELLRGHTSWVTSLDWMPDGKQLASGSEDGTILIWNIP